MPGASKQPMPLAGQMIIAAFFLAMMLPLIGSTFINTQIMKEQSMILRWYGPVHGAEINARADSWFRLWAMRSGMMQKTIHMFDPKTSEDAATKVASNVKPIVIHDSNHHFGDINGAQNTSSNNNSRPRHFWYWWITAAFALIYFAMLRFSTFVVWIPMVIPISVAILVTGSTVRRLKWHGFGGVNPLQYRAGVRLTGWMFGIGMGMFFMPGALPPVTIASAVLLSVAGFAMVMANRQKPS